MPTYKDHTAMNAIKNIMREQRKGNRPREQRTRAEVISTNNKKQILAAR